MSNVAVPQARVAPLTEPLRVPLGLVARRDRLQAVNVTRAIALAETVAPAITPWTRLRGLLARPRLQPGEAMLLRPCAAVHTWMMRYPIDVAFIDDGGVVVAQRANLRPWSMTGWQPGAAAALELPAGTLGRTGTCPGDQVVFVQRRC